MKQWPRVSAGEIFMECHGILASELEDVENGYNHPLLRTGAAVVDSQHAEAENI